MSTTTRRYSKQSVQVFLSPYRLTGFKGDTPVMVSPVTPDDEHEISIDGVSFTLNQSLDNRHIVSLDMDPEGQGYKYLSEILTEQRADEAGAIPARAFRLYDASNGDDITSDAAVIISRPEIGLGKGRDAVQFRIVLPNPTVRTGTAL